MWCRSLILGSLAGLLLLLPAAAQVQPGDAAPAWPELQLEGTLPDLEGRVVLLDVWASWCAPCKASFPALSRLHHEFAERGVVIVGVSVDQREREFRVFVERLAPPFPVLRDAAKRFATRYQPPGMPTTYLIDRQGRVRERHVGFFGERTTAQLRAQLQALLDETP